MTGIKLPHQTCYYSSCFNPQEVENVKKIGVPEDHTFFVHLRCVNCNDITQNAVGISREMEVEGIRGASVNLQMKCKGCGRVNDISLVPEENPDDAGFLADGDEWQRLATFECRGVDLHEYEIRDGYFVVAGDEKSRFEDADLSDDWCEVDEKGNPLTISKVRAKFTAASKKGKKKK